MRNLQIELAQFTGTENYYYLPGLESMLYTDGVKYFAEQAGAYWFLAIVATEVMAFHEQEEFIKIELNVQGSAATLTANDGNGNIFYTRAIEFTDAPEGVWKFYLIENILLLPSEY
ncbi:MAG: DUF6876 family protein [Methylobacter sp.]